MPKISSEVKKIKKICLEALDDMKAQDVSEIDIDKYSSFASNLIIATGTSSRHLKSISEKIIDTLKDNKIKILGTEGQEAKEWILIDIGDILVNIMTEESREHYDLESLWDRAVSYTHLTLPTKA